MLFKPSQSHQSPPEPSRAIQSSVYSHPVSFKPIVYVFDTFWQICTCFELIFFALNGSEDAHERHPEPFGWMVFSMLTLLFRLLIANKATSMAVIAFLDWLWAYMALVP